jgi:hypothetical protein
VTNNNPGPNDPRFDTARLLAISTFLVTIAIIAIYGLLVWKFTTSSSHPPLLADPAPTKAPTLSNDGTGFAPQYRGAYDQNARIFDLITLTLPLLTTILGFYFGNRIGSAEKGAALAEAGQQVAEIKTKVQAAAVDGNADVASLVQDLESSTTAGLSDFHVGDLRFWWQTCARNWCRRRHSDHSRRRVRVRSVVRAPAASSR